MSEASKPLDLDQLKKNETFCAYPFVQISTVPAGFFRPCCYFRRWMKKADSTNYSIRDGDIENVWNSSDIRDIRKKMVSGERLKECQQCYSEEATGKTSMRFRSHSEWLSDERVQMEVLEAERNDFVMKSGPRYLELKPGSLCNLKCRICNQFDSTQIASEMKALSEKYEGIRMDSPRLFSSYTIEADFDPSMMPDWSEFPEFWNSIEKALPFVETISFAGGEPTLLKEVHQLIRKCVSSGHSKHIHVFLSSNFTYVNKELIDLAQQFSWFEFIGSIDGFGPIQEYIRYPSKWAVVSDNFAAAKMRMIPGQMKALINLTLEMYNILNFTDVLDWLEQLDQKGPRFFHYPFAINLLCSPEYLCIDVLPQAGRNIAISRIQSYLNRSEFIKTFPDLRERFDLIIHRLNQPLIDLYEENLAQFWKSAMMLDQHRRQKLEQVQPLLYQIVSEEIRRLKLDVTLPYKFDKFDKFDKVDKIDKIGKLDNLDQIDKIDKMVEKRAQELAR